MEQIPLNKGYSALVDDEDADMVLQYNWGVSKQKNTYYARAHKGVGFYKYTKIHMHWLILPPKDGFVRDHIDGNGLNNQRYNLRYCTNTENIWNSGISKNNTSGFRGVCWYKQKNRWIVRIWCKKKKMYLGSFTDKIEAAKAYNEKAIELFGEFARLNEV